MKAPLLWSTHQIVNRKNRKKGKFLEKLKGKSIYISFRRKCKKRDDDYLAMREEIVSLAKAMQRTDAVRIKIWLTKLDETLSLLTWKTNRNQYAALMIKQ
jgi:hypothetical protein